MKKFLRKLLSLTALVLTVTNAWAESETVTSVATLASPSRLNNHQLFQQLELRAEYMDEWR